MVENMCQLIHEENRLLEKAEEADDCSKSVLFIFFLDLEVLKHEAGEVDVFHPMVIDLGQVLKPVRKIVVMTDDQAEFYPGRPKERILVQSLSERFNGELLFVHGFERKAVEIAVEIV